MQIFRGTFGGRLCEIAVQCSNSDPGPIVAWALRVRSDGKLEPIFGRRGNILREYADTPEDAVASLKRQLVVLLGDERP